MVNRVVPTQIHKAASRMHTAVTAVSKHIPTEVGDIGDALPGSQSASAGTALKQTWHTDYTNWVKSANAHVTAMHHAADTWTKTDHTHAAQQEKMAREMDGMY
ncbi:hypothetical protein [Nocardioides sp. KR10-350]|uniref:hypothetical protein n=1 Tax=Nocardioides cheoyonin TaxID=3156615 RepID=UPI0032B3E1A9